MKHIAYGIVPRKSFPGKIVIRKVFEVTKAEVKRLDQYLVKLPKFSAWAVNAPPPKNMAKAKSKKKK
jgi:hypothetical protein